MLRRGMMLILVMAVLLAGCAAPAAVEMKQYNATFLTLFDTVTSINGLAESQEAFSAKAQQVHDALLEYHQLFDIYNSYEGLANIKTINDQAGVAPVEVDGRIIQLLLDCRAYYDLTGGMVNVAMGSVLKLWHEARNDGLDDPANAALPDREKLEEAAGHTTWESIVIDEAASTVFITDPAVRLDVGAVAKGWAAQQVAAHSPAGLLISVGGNVCATGPKDEAGTPWRVGVTDPNGGESYLHTLNITSGCVVTSGDYQRYYVVDGKPYHHIIHPETLMPADLWRSVTVLCQDSGMADALSTALFLLDQQAGQQLLTACGAEAMWVDAQGNFFYSPGFAQFVRT